MGRTMFTDLWQLLLSQSEQDQASLQKQNWDVEKQTQALLDRKVEASGESVLKAYEARIEKCERENLVLEERSQILSKPKRDLSEVIEPALRFLTNPWSISKW